MKKIEVLGAGCAKCNRLEANVREALKSSSSDAKVVKVEDIGEIMERGVMMTPALVVDGEVKVTGRVPSVDELKRILK